MDIDALGEARVAFDVAEEKYRAKGKGQTSPPTGQWAGGGSHPKGSAKGSREQGDGQKRKWTDWKSASKWQGNKKGKGCRQDVSLPVN